MHKSASKLGRRAWAVERRLLPLAVAVALASACGGQTVNASGTSGPDSGASPQLVPIKSQVVDKVDLLFMIDNSINMADKQALLVQAVPQLVDRLVNPIQVCSDAQGHTTPAHGSGCSGQYPNGPRQEFKPIYDMHIGIVTSSLGGHGMATNFCNPQGLDAKPGSTHDDHGHLLPKVRQGLTSYQNMGFLSWDGSQTAAAFGSTFADHVKAVGEQGCGFESSLEAWYRFLVDPQPPQSVKVENNLSTPSGVDQEVLTERKNFLRADSLLGIVMLTDEDDCSIPDSGLGWLVARQDHMPRATQACATNPNDKCCRSCALQEGNGPPVGCTPIPSDPSCTKGAFTDQEDPLNLRCFQQKRRFGLDLLYPIQRYVNALTQLQLCTNRPDLSCEKGGSPEANPIFSGYSASGGARDPSLVFLAAITGVPWQDIATNNTLTTANTLKYKTADQLKADGIWDDILGDVNKYVEPKDPLMQESIDPRSGNNPITGDAIAPPGAGPLANPINGHEYDIPSRNDLQYACIFPLATPKTTGTDCSTYGYSGNSPNKPLCQDPKTGGYGTTQYFAKAYPGLRQLQVLKDLGQNSVLASICPKVLDPGQTDFGYNPAVDAIVERFKSAFAPRCLPEKLTPDPVTKRVPCTVLEALLSSSAYSYKCGQKAGREPVSDKLAAAVRERLKGAALCDVAGQPACSDFNVCAIPQVPLGPGLDSCLHDDPVKPGVDGFCYVDSQQGNPAFISSCPANERQMLRFVPPAQTPTPGALVFLSCGG